MRIHEILKEQSYASQVSTSVSDLLASAKASGLKEIPTQKLINALKNIGYNVSVDNIMPILGENPFVKSATPTSIELEDGVEDAITTDDVDSQEKVAQLAQQAVGK